MIKYRIVQLESGMWKVQRRYLFCIWLYDLTLYSTNREKYITECTYKDCHKALKYYRSDKNGENKDVINKIVEFTND